MSEIAIHIFKTKLTENIKISFNFQLQKNSNVELEMNGT
jgi:hypothetical protein